MDTHTHPRTRYGTVTHTPSTESLKDHNKRQTVEKEGFCPIAPFSPRAPAFFWLDFLCGEEGMREKKERRAPPSVFSPSCGWGPAIQLHSNGEQH